MSSLHQRYLNDIRPALKKQLGYTSVMQVPVLQKITLNMGVGSAIVDKKNLERAMAEMELIAGQKPIKTLARKSVASFKVREGWPIGCKVTLRNKRMWDFLERLIHISIPRIRDFRGLNPKAFDGMGNYNLGVKEQIIFPEIDYDKIDSIRGLDMAFTTSATNDSDAFALLKELRFPFRVL